MPQEQTKQLCLGNDEKIEVVSRLHRAPRTREVNACSLLDRAFLNNSRE